MEHNKPGSGSASRLAATLHFSFIFSTPVAHFAMAKVLAALRLGRRDRPFLSSRHANAWQRTVPGIQNRRKCGVVNVMDKSNVAFALLSVILGLYIAVALLLSRVRGSGTNKTAHHQPAHHRMASTGRN